MNSSVQSTPSPTCLARQIQGLKLLAASASDSMSTQDDLQWQANISVLKGHLGCDAFAAYEYRDGYLHLQLHEGLPEHLTVLLRLLAPGQAPCGECAQSRKLLYLGGADFEQASKCKPLRDEGFQAFVGVPLIVDEELIGVISFVSRTRRTFDPVDLDFVDTIGQIFATAKRQQILTRQKQQSEETNRRILSDARMVTWEADALSLDFTFLSGPCDALLGFSSTEWQEPGFWRERIYEHDADTVLEKLSQSRGKQRFDFRMQHANGSQVWIEAIVEPVQPTDGQKRVLRGVLSDIAARKSLEDQLRHSQKMEAVGRLASGIAHDFNNLLTVIGAHAELIELRGMPPHIAESVDAIQDASNRASRLTSQLLMFGRKSACRRGVLDLNELILQARPLIESLLKNQVALRLDLQTPLPRISADPSHLDQVLVNLCVNARDAMANGGTVTISTKVAEVTDEPSLSTQLTPGKYVTLTIADTGIGMTEEVRAAACEPFFTTKPVGEGSGLGLAVVYGAVQELSGSISLQSEPNAGTTVTILLPATTKEPSSRAIQQPEFAVCSQTILLVEDEDSIRSVLRSALTSQGYRVIESTNAVAALQLLETIADDVSLILTDVAMPGMSGHELSNTVYTKHPGLPIICMSGHNDMNPEPQSVYAFLQKPFSLQTLFDRVRETIEARHIG